MRRFAVCWMLVLSLLALAAPSVVRGGVFCYVIRCAQIEISPPRYRAVFGVYDRFAGLPTLGFRADTTSFFGASDPAPVLEADGPDWLTVHLDPIRGRVDWLADTARTFRQDSLSVVTDRQSFCLRIVYLDAAGGEYDVNYLCFSADTVTAARGPTWGKLKDIYRR